MSLLFERALKAASRASSLPTIQDETQVSFDSHLSNVAKDMNRDSSKPQSMI